MVAFGPDGSAYLATIAPAFAVWRSKDGGRNWDGPAFVGDSARFDDRQWLAPSARTADLVAGVTKTRDRTAASGRDLLVTTLSRDGGATFASLHEIHLDSGYLQAATYLLGRRDGSFVVPFQANYARTNEGIFRGAIWVVTSPDGVRYSTPHFVTEWMSYGETGGDRRWKGLGVTPMAEAPERGPDEGALYLTWSAPRGDRLQIMFSRSRDGGRSWSRPARVNGGGDRSNHSSPMIAVNRDGVIAITWNDRRDDPGDQCFRPYVAISLDGGRTFVHERRISDRATCPGAGSRWLNGGETHGLAALPDGSFRIVWSSGAARDLRLWTSEFVVRR